MVNGRSVSQDIYSDLSWPIGKIEKRSQLMIFPGLVCGHTLVAHSILVIPYFEQIYRKANAAYDALSMRLGDQDLFFSAIGILFILCFGLCAT